MRVVKYKDKKGYLRVAQIKDEDPDSWAKYGVPKEIPNLNELLDWDGLKRDLHNALIEAGFYTLEDVMRAANGYRPAVTVFKRYLNEVYRLDSSKEDSANKSVGG